MLAIKNILAQTEIDQLFKVLIDGKYIMSIATNELSQNQEEAVHEDTKYYVLGPRTFIDLKSWMDQKTEHARNECLLCSDYVMYKGFKCGRCPNIMHTQCIQNYFESVNNGSFKCPSCQNVVDIDSIDDIDSCIHLLAHPNDCMSIIQNLKQIKEQSEEKKAEIEMNMEVDDEESDSY